MAFGNPGSGSTVQAGGGSSWMKASAQASMYAFKASCVAASMSLESNSPSTNAMASWTAGFKSLAAVMPREIQLTIWSRIAGFILFGNGIDLDGVGCGLKLLDFSQDGVHQVQSRWSGCGHVGEPGNAILLGHSGCGGANGVKAVLNVG